MSKSKLNPVTILTCIKTENSLNIMVVLRVVKEVESKAKHTMKIEVRGRVGKTKKNWMDGQHRCGAVWRRRLNPLQGRTKEGNMELVVNTQLTKYTFILNK